MKKYTPLIIASSLAVLLAVGMALRINSKSRTFQKAVREALKTSEGYDQRFIDMVNRLEHELALRASFGYVGKKDPMTGRERLVAEMPVAPVKRKPRRTQAAVVKDTPKEPVVEIDPVRLTAIIFEDNKRSYTAVVMDGERSYSVEVGDKVAGRRITRITSRSVFMENDEERFIYDILGNTTRKKK